MDPNHLEIRVHIGQTFRTMQAMQAMQAVQNLAVGCPFQDLRLAKARRDCSSTAAGRLT